MPVITNFPNCCALNIVHGFSSYADNRVKKQNGYFSPMGFVAVFSQNQKKAFDDLCKQHKLTGALKIKGQHGRDLVLCHFLWRK